jgi:hypothetical protein
MSKAVLVFEFSAEQSAEIGQILLGKVLTNGVSGAIDAVKALAQPAPEVPDHPAVKLNTPEKPKKAPKASIPSTTQDSMNLEEIRERLQEYRTKNADLSLAPIFAKFGAAKLSDINSLDYAALLAEVESQAK